ncbi:MAG: protease pro-enzyme activation domain-containing protein [Acidobacteriota bacterium]|nr:protease pro-enzyme activation domain-containing protein [Acidobacteriota bacterium]
MRTRFGLVTVVAWLWAGSLAADDGFKHFENSIVPLPRSPEVKTAALSAKARQRRLNLHFALDASHQQELESRVARGEVVPAEEMKHRYAGDEQSVKKLLAWLRSQGFRILETTPGFTDVYVSASVARIEKSLHVKMVAVTSAGETAPAAVTAPRLPHGVADAVVSIGGLQPFNHPITRPLQ